MPKSTAVTQIVADVAQADEALVNVGGDIGRATFDLLPLLQAVSSPSSTTIPVFSGTDGKTIAKTNVTIDGNDMVTAEGVQSNAQAVIATATGATTGTIVDGSTFCTVTNASDANDIVVLPTPTPGNIVWLYASEAFELRSDTPASVAINGGTGASAESAITATWLVRCVCTSATTWVCSTFTATGTEAALAAAT